MAIHSAAAPKRSRDKHQNDQKFTKSNRDATQICPFTPKSHPEESLRTRTHRTILYQAKILAIKV